MGANRNRYVPYRRVHAVQKIAIHNFERSTTSCWTANHCKYFGTKQPWQIKHPICQLSLPLSPLPSPPADDFFAFREEGESEMWVDQNSPNCRAGADTFRKYVNNNGTVEIRKKAILDQDTSVSSTIKDMFRNPENGA